MSVTDTQEALLNAAEELLAKRGMYGVSLSEVARAAHQQNKSAIQYHFGSREDLAEAVATRHLAAANVRRSDLLHTLELTGRTHDVRALVEALVLPPFLQMETLRSHYFRFLSYWTLHVRSAEVFDELLEHPDASSLRQVLSRIDEELADIDPVVRQFRYRSGLIAVIRALAEYETTLAEGGELDERIAITALVDMATGMITAPDHTGDLHL